MKSNYSSWDLKLLTNSQFQKLNQTAKFKYLVHFGHLASSTHNTQPWAFKQVDDSIQIYLDNSRVLPASDIIGRQACVSIGCAVGNIIVAAKSYGYFSSLKWEINGDIIPSQKYVLVSTIKLGKSKIDKVSLKYLPTILARRIERRRHDVSKDFPVSFYKSLNQILSSQNEIDSRIWHRGDPRIHLVAELQSQADTYVANSAKFSKELADWLLPNNTKQFLGMPGSTFNLTDTQTDEVIEGLANKSKMHADSLAGFSSSGKKGIESAAIIAMLTVSKQTIKNWVGVGIVLSNVQNLVELHRGGLALHAGLAEVTLVRMSLSAMGMTTSQPVILFRAGIRDESTARLPHAPRLPIDQVLL